MLRLFVALHLLEYEHTFEENSKFKLFPWLPIELMAHELGCSQYSLSGILEAFK